MKMMYKRQAQFLILILDCCCCFWFVLICKSNGLGESWGKKIAIFFVWELGNKKENNFKVKVEGWAFDLCNKKSKSGILGFFLI